jgi:hypothetical protein
MVSRYTLLRVCCRLPLPCDSTPPVLGIDDVAFRKRQAYGTVLIAPECRRHVAWLPDREAETVALWLQAHPGVEVIARDRSTAYARGIRQGAPTSTQVADRFQLLQNLAEPFEQVLSRHSAALKVVNEAMRSAGIAPHDSPGVAPVPLAPRPPLAQAIATRRRAQRLATYGQVWTLRRRGYSGEAIARQLGIGRCTVFRYLRAPRVRNGKHGAIGGGVG